MSLTRRVYGGKKSRNSKKGRGHCRIGGKKTLKKGGKRVLSFGGKSLKNRKKSKRRSKRGGEADADAGGEADADADGEVAAVDRSYMIADVSKLARLNPIHFLMTPEEGLAVTSVDEQNVPFVSSPGLSGA